MQYFVVTINYTHKIHSRAHTHTHNLAIIVYTHFTYKCVCVLLGVWVCMCVLKINFVKMWMEAISCYCRKMDVRELKQKICKMVWLNGQWVKWSNNARFFWVFNTFLRLCVYVWMCLMNTYCCQYQVYRRPSWWGLDFVYNC